MKHIYRIYIVILFFSYILSYAIIGVKPALSQPMPLSAADYSIEKAVSIADQKQKEAHTKAMLINDYYNKGKLSFQARKYKEAKGYFDQILEIDPSYEPAKLFIESAIIHLEIAKERQEINRIKLKMADIIAEYDRRRERVDSLAIKYFLEQAQAKCQMGDLKGAQEHYNLCYKVDPYSKAKIEWFVNTTYDLQKLTRELDEHAKRIDELAVLE